MSAANVLWRERGFKVGVLLNFGARSLGYKRFAGFAALEGRDWNLCDLRNLWMETEKQEVMMPRELLVDLSAVDITKVAYPIEEVRKFNPQRYEMEQLSYVAAFDGDEGYAVGVRKLGTDEFWARGHIPGRPLFPGVLMVEAAAQLCSFAFHMMRPGDDRFLGFGGIDAVKFRGEVKPGDTLVIIAKAIEIRSRRAVFDTQAVLDARLVFEGRITGMPI